MILPLTSRKKTSLESLLLLFFVVAIGCLLYKLIEAQSLKHSAVLFIGIPVLMSVFIASTCNIRHITLNVMLGLSIGLLASFVYLNEGSFCVPMTAPLFLLTGLIVSASFIKLRQSSYNKPYYFLPLFFLFLLSFEGFTSHTSLNRNEHVSAFKYTHLSEKTILLSLSQNKSFTALPTFLSYGFPQPTAVTNSGISIGDIRTVYFSGGEGEPGTSVFEITKRTHNSIEYTLIEDSSHISHWLNWKKSRVSWKKLPNDIIRVTWAIDYERQLDPAWYFAPLQYYAVQLSAETLIDNLVTDISD